MMKLRTILLQKAKSKFCRIQLFVVALYHKTNKQTMNRNILFAILASLFLISCSDSKNEQTTPNNSVGFVIQTRVDTIWVEDLETAMMVEIIVESQDTIFVK